MTSSWQNESGRLACCWSEAGRTIPYDFPWIQDQTRIPSGYLRPLPDFASRSPFGGVAWFQPNPADSQNE